MTTLPGQVGRTGLCSQCRGVHQLRIDGMLRRHDRAGQPCPGSGRAPARRERWPVETRTDLLADADLAPVGLCLRRGITEGA